MFIRQKLGKILNRVSYAFKNEIKAATPELYAQGFSHALMLFKIAFDKEFTDYVQIEANKHQEIRDLKKEIERLNTSLGNKQRFINHLENMILKTEANKLSNRQRKKIIRAICSLTGQQYDVIRDEFDTILNIRKGALND